MNHSNLLADSLIDYLNLVTLGWWSEVPGPYRFAFAAILVVVIWPPVRKLLSKSAKEHKHLALRRGRIARWCMATGALMTLGSALAFYVSRYNCLRIRELQRQVEAYRQQNPISSTLFGVPGADAMEAEVKSLASFAYTFVPPLTPMEGIVFVGFFGGLSLMSYGGRCTKPQAGRNPRFERTHPSIPATAGDHCWSNGMTALSGSESTH